MKNHYSLFIVSVLVLFAGLPLRAQKSGEDLFKTTCAACHTIGNGRLVGPDLSGVNDRREQDWLIKFIRSSRQLIKENDPDAVAIFKEYNNIPMPDNNLNDDEIIQILSYIREEGSSAPVQETSQEKTPDTIRQTTTLSYSPNLLNKGKALFYGYEKFSNGAPSCAACHYIQDESIIGGGKLSFDLTASYGRLGQAGIQAILTNPPFPAMSVALRDKDLTDDEKEAVTAMLHFANDRYAGKPKRSNDAVIFLTLSIVFAMFLLVNIYILYDNRKVPNG